MPVLALLAAFVAGVIMAVQGSINTALGKIVGLLEATLLVHVVGTAFLLVALYIIRLGHGDLNNVSRVPWHLYLGGLLGVAILYLVVTGISQAGVAAATTSIIVGQVGTALFIDTFGLFGLDKVPFSWIKVAGIGLLAIGARLMLVK